MIAGVFDPEGTGAVRHWLARLENAAGLSKGTSLLEDRAGIMAWASSPAGSIERPGFALLGRVTRTDLPLTLDHASKLSGVFSAIAPAADGLVLARGWFGGRPLYYFRDGERIVACSRLAPLVAIYPQRPRLNVAFLAANLATTGFDDPTATAFEGIQRARAGEVVHVTPRSKASRSLRFEVREPFDAPPQEIAAQLGMHLRGAVRRAMGGAKRVGVLAGGGIDSSAILAAAVAEARGASASEVEALTLDFEGPECDRPYLRELAAALGIVPIRVAPKTLAPVVEGALILDAAPYVSLSVGWDVMLPSLAKQRGADVVLTGVAGDDIFDGDVRIFAERALAGDPIGAWRAVVRLQAYFRPSTARRLRTLLVSPVLRKTVPGVIASARRRQNLRRRARAHFPWAGPRMREYLAVEHDDGVLPSDSVGLSTGERLRAMAGGSFWHDYADRFNALESTFGFEHADPFFDPELVEFVARIPPEMFFFGDQMRGLFREAIRGLVPDRVRLRPDKARFEPAHAEIFQPLRNAPWLRDLLSMRSLGQLGLVEPEAYRAHFEQQIQRGDWLSVWPPVAVEAFVRWVGEGKGSSPSSRCQDAVRTVSSLVLGGA